MRKFAMPGIGHGHETRLRRLGIFRRCERLCEYTPRWAEMKAQRPPAAAHPNESLITTVPTRSRKKY